MKKRTVILLLAGIAILTSCGTKTTSTKTSNTTSKTVNQVLAEQTGKNADDKNHGGNVTNPNDQSNKQAPAVSGGASQINGGSNMKRSANNAQATLQASDIDIDLTRLSSTMVYSEVSNMMTAPEQYVGKVVRMNGNLAIYRYPERNYYTCIIKDATACCQQGMEFVLTNEKYPNEGDGIIVTGVFDIYYEDDVDANGNPVKNKYCQLKDATLVKSRT